MILKVYWWHIYTCRFSHVLQHCLRTKARRQSTFQFIRDCLNKVRKNPKTEHYVGEEGKTSDTDLQGQGSSGYNSKQERCLCKTVQQASNSNTKWSEQRGTGRDRAGWELGKQCRRETQGFVCFHFETSMLWEHITYLKHEVLGKLCRSSDHWFLICTAQTRHPWTCDS